MTPPAILREWLAAMRRTRQRGLGHQSAAFMRIEELSPEEA